MAEFFLKALQLAELELKHLDICDKCKALVLEMLVDLDEREQERIEDAYKRNEIKDGNK